MNEYNQIVLDDKLAEYIVDNVSIFEYIHPNIISLISHLCNILIFFQLFIDDEINVPYFAILMFIRYITDILDGAVARKYNKTSRIGHLLDDWGDIIMGTILILYVTKNIFNIDYIYPIISLIIITILWFSNFENSDINHDEAKNLNNSKNIFRQILAFLINNSFVLYIIAFVLIY